MAKSLIPKISLLIALSIATALTTLAVSRHLRGATNNEEPTPQVGMWGRMLEPGEPRAEIKPLEEWDRGPWGGTH